MRREHAHKVMRLALVVGMCLLGLSAPPGNAQGNFAESEAAAAGQVTISGVPAYWWQHGSAPTAAGMLLGYWDGRGYELVSGDASTQTTAVNEMIASAGHIADYAEPKDYAPNPIGLDKSEPPVGDEHPDNSLADFMKTSQSAKNNYYGETWASDIPAGLEDYVALVAPALVTSARNYDFEEFDWSHYKAEIDAGRPMILVLDDGVLKLEVTAVGYREEAGVRYYEVIDTRNASRQEFRWAPVAGGEPWGVRTITTFHIHTAPPPAPANDEIGAATLISSLPYTARVDTTWSTENAGDPVLPCGPATRGPHSVWYRVQPGAKGIFTVNTFGSNYDTVLSAWRGSPGALTALACNDDSSGTLQSKVRFYGEPGQTYYIEASGYYPYDFGWLKLSAAFKPNTFADVPVAGKEWMVLWIEDFYAAGMTTGCAANPLRYCPERAVTRAEMAVFILRALNYPALPYDPPDRAGTFADMPVAGKEWMEQWVEEFAALGITRGCAIEPLRYCPEREVTRAEMAVFILRALYGGDYQPPAQSGTFADVPVSGKEWMGPWIEQFYDLGITTGCAAEPLRYCPERAVTRAELAVFVLRAFDKLPGP